MNWDEDLTKALSITRLSLIQTEKCVRLRSSLPCGYYGDAVKPYTCAPAVGRNIKSESRVHCLTALTFISKFQAWIMKSQAQTAWVNQVKLFAHASQRQETFNKSDSRITVPTLFAMPICASGSYGSFAGCRIKARV
jgi:hypothetical protein